MQLTDAQKQQVSEWIAAGAKLSEIQNRLEQEFEIRMTYMDLRFLVDDLQLTLQDPPEAEKAAAEVPQPDSGPEAMPLEGAEGGADLGQDSAEPPMSGKVNVSVDMLARPGSIVSGKVTFSDGQSAEWYLDQLGRLGMVPAQQGYRPPEADVTEFQLALEKELMQRGF